MAGARTRSRGDIKDEVGSIHLARVNKQSRRREREVDYQRKITGVGRQRKRDSSLLSPQLPRSLVSSLF